MKLSRMEWFLQIVLSHFLVLFAGLFAIYYIECRINIPSRDLAKTAAGDLSGLSDEAWRMLQKEEIQEDVLTDADQYLTYSVFYRRAASASCEPIRRYYGQRSLEIDGKLHEYNGYFVRHKTFYAVQGSLKPLELVSIAAEPVQRDGRFGGFVYVARVLDYAPPFFIVYALASTVLFYLVVLYLAGQRKNRERIEQIYHRYIANISHELKTPIASIQAITEVLTDGDAVGEETRSMYYGMISRESRLLEHAVLQIIELSKLQDHKQRFEKTYISPHELLDPIAKQYTDRCEEIGISFSIDERVYDLPLLHTDPYRMTQLLTILLDNAYKFVPDDGHIFIDATSKHGQATLRINDDGRGISEEDFPHVFERFYKTEKDNPTGTGLGLAIAKEIVAGLDEKIWVQSREGEGTIFFVTVATAT